MFLEISQNSQENTCARFSSLIKLPATLDSLWNATSSHRRCFVRKSGFRNFAKFLRKHLCQVISCKFCEISKNTCFFLQNIFFYRTPLVAASVYFYLLLLPVVFKKVNFQGFNLVILNFELPSAFEKYAILCGNNSVLVKMACNAFQWR